MILLLPTMNNFKPKKNKTIILLIIIIIGIIWFAVTNNYSKQNDINLIVYLQDKKAALSSDCSVTYPKKIKVSRTEAVADASLKYLFKNELSQYGDYKSVTIKNGVARVTISTISDPIGRKISSLSSCEAGHLFAVLEDTLTQYETITSVELYSSSEKIEF